MRASRFAQGHEDGVHERAVVAADEEPISTTEDLRSGAFGIAARVPSEQALKWLRNTHS
jgi:hypothetical protein